MENIDIISSTTLRVVVTINKAVPKSTTIQLVSAPFGLHSIKATHQLNQYIYNTIYYEKDL